METENTSDEWQFLPPKEGRSWGGKKQPWLSHEPQKEYYSFASLLQVVDFWLAV